MKITVECSECGAKAIIVTNQARIDSIKFLEVDYALHAVLSPSCGMRAFTSVEYKTFHPKMFAKLES